MKDKDTKLLTEAYNTVQEAIPSQMTKTVGGKQFTRSKGGAWTQAKPTVSTPQTTRPTVNQVANKAATGAGNVIKDVGKAAGTVFKAPVKAAGAAISGAGKLAKGILGGLRGEKPATDTSGQHRTFGVNKKGGWNTRTTSAQQKIAQARKKPGTDVEYKAQTVEKPIKEPVTAVDPMADTTRSIGGKDVDVTKMADWEPAKVAYDAEQASDTDAAMDEWEFDQQMAKADRRSQKANRRANRKRSPGSHSGRIEPTNTADQAAAELKRQGVGIRGRNL